MAVKYFQGNNDDLAPLSSIGVDDDSACNWWGGVQKCFASVAIASALATATLSGQVAEQISQDREEIPAGFLTTQAYIASPPQAFQIKLQGGGYTVRYASPDSDDFPVTVVATPVDEDYWQNPVPPVAASNRLIPLFTVDSCDIFATVTNQPAEDFWQNSVPPVGQQFFRFPYLAEPDSIPAGSLFGQYDEDFWQSGVAPSPASFYQRLPLGDPEEIPAANLYGQTPEDYWVNAVRPVPWALYQPLPYFFDAGEFASTFESEEDFWQNPTAPVPASNRFPQQWGFDEQEPAGSLSGTTPEDYWQNPVAPVSASIYRSPLFTDPEEIPAGSLLKSQVQDEAYWQIWALPVPASFYQKFPYGYESGDVAVSAQNGTALPAGLSLVAAENDPTAIAQASGRGGKRIRRGFPTERPSIHALARPQGLSLVADYSKPSARGDARAQASILPGLTVDYRNPTAKGIRNPTDEELIAILMGV